MLGSTERLRHWLTWIFGKKKDPSSQSRARALRCSFCNKSQYDVKKLIAGPRVQICDECVDICLDIVSAEKKRSIVEGRIEPVGRAWPPAGPLLLCGLCRTATTLDQSLVVPERGIVCAGCVGAFEAALFERVTSTTDAADRQTIVTLSAALVEAVNSGDVEGVLSVWADDGVLMPPHHAAVHGRVAIKDFFTELFQRAKFKFVFTESVISIEGDVAIERITYTATSWAAGSMDPVEDRGKGLHVYKREQDSWRLAFDIWNTDVPRVSLT
jgi:uncharacterized protein (TIGR02246 family)